MTAKLDIFSVAHGPLKPWIAASQAAEAGLEKSLVELVKMRASIVNGCANCINMHSGDALAAGETRQRLLLLSAWREAPCYSDRERAALAWTDALTTLSQGHTQDAAWGALSAQFNEEERVKLTLLINIINGWNRLAVGFDLWIETPESKALAA